MSGRALLAILLVSLHATTVPALCAGTGSASSDAPLSSARLVETHGIVFKRGFVDWVKETWGDPEPAAAGDTLHEGMQIGTGARSWAQVTWPNVTTRAWEKTVFAVAPHQKLVYLMGGEMLFRLDKRRKDKRDYLIWTKLLQVRVRGTTVLIQSTPDTSRITVLEGTVDVLNRIDRSVLRIKPGVVYEIRTAGPAAVENRNGGQVPVARHVEPPSPETPREELSEENTTSGSDSSTVSGTSSTGSSRPLAVVHDICVHDKSPVPVFETRNTSSDLRLANVESLLSHPLLDKFDTPLESLELVKECLSELAPVCQHRNDGNEAGPARAGKGTVEGKPARSMAAPLPSGRQQITSESRYMDMGATHGASDPAPPAVTGVNAGDGSAGDKGVMRAIANGAEVLRVPTRADYKLGPAVGTALKLPANALATFTPVGFIGQHPASDHTLNPIHEQMTNLPPPATKEILLGGPADSNLKLNRLNEMRANSGPLVGAVNHHLQHNLAAINALKDMGAQRLPFDRIHPPPHHFADGSFNNYNSYDGHNYSFNNNYSTSNSPPPEGGGY